MAMIKKNHGKEKLGGKQAPLKKNNDDGGGKNNLCFFLLVECWNTHKRWFKTFKLTMHIRELEKNHESK